MRPISTRALVLTASIMLFITLIPSCQEQSAVDPKSCPAQNKLLAAKNRDLETVIVRLKKNHKNEIKRKEREITKCLREKEAIANKATQDTQGLLENALSLVPEEVAKLHEENETLKLQVRELQKENQRLREQVEMLEKELSKRPEMSDQPQPL